ncbi:hypothetical protein ESCO_003147 [Escovopsis weberi]|uniref:Uncharacterized protein n=1 Tax=Escovopsis weberi TaxID=150374 RepID=A0A0M9VSD8_ESCWE|nr:hypothetical protein ESCO_003147 [Escovopsis weberi]
MDDSGSSYINNNNNNNNNTASYSGPSYITSSNPNLNSSSSTSSSSTIPAASNGGALGKLLPKAMVKRRKKIRGGRDSDAAAPDDNRARSVPAPEIASLEIDDSHFLSMADDEDLDGRSFGSFESGGAEPDLESEG